MVREEQAGSTGYHKISDTKPHIPFLRTLLLEKGFGKKYTGVCLLQYIRRQGALESVVRCKAGQF